MTASLLRGALFAMLLGIESASAADHAPADSPATETLGEEGFRVVCYLPEAQGFYQGTRFDWSGMIASLSCAGHQYFATWPDAHATQVNHAAGPAEEFDISQDGLPAPPGYAEASPGEPFLKIGVGWLRKDQAAKYHPFDPYTILDRGTWRSTRDANSITFVQELTPRGGYGCVYQKRLSIDPAARTLRIAHTLKNTGTKPLDTHAYCHNFLCLDGAPTGAGYRLTQIPDLSPAGGSAVPFLERQGTAWVPGARFDGFPVKFRVPSGEKLVVQVSQPASGASMEMATEQAADAFQVYAERAVFCPEPFVFLHLAPNEEAAWSWRYVFQP